MTKNTGNEFIPMIKPDDRLRAVVDAKSDGDGSDAVGPAVAGFVLLKLNGYLKPPLAEDLSAPGGDNYSGSCTCNSVCTCVPVQTCACDSVCSCDSVQGCVVCVYSCYGGGAGYWQPC